MQLSRKVAQQDFQKRLKDPNKQVNFPKLSGRSSEGTAATSLAAKSILMTRTPTNEAITDQAEKSLSLMQTASGEVEKPKHRHPYLKSVVMADVNSPYPESSPSPRGKSNTNTGKSSTIKIKKTRSESKKQIIEHDGIVIKPVVGSEMP